MPVGAGALGFVPWTVTLSVTDPPKVTSETDSTLVIEEVPLPVFLSIGLTGLRGLSVLSAAFCGEEDKNAPATISPKTTTQTDAASSFWFLVK